MAKFRLDIHGGTRRALTVVESLHCFPYCFVILQSHACCDRSSIPAISLHFNSFRLSRPAWDDPQASTACCSVAANRLPGVPMFEKDGVARGLPFTDRWAISKIRQKGNSQFEAFPMQTSFGLLARRVGATKSSLQTLKTKAKRVFVEPVHCSVTDVAAAWEPQLRFSDKKRPEKPDLPIQM